MNKERRKSNLKNFRRATAVTFQESDDSDLKTSKISRIFNMFKTKSSGRSNLNLASLITAIEASGLRLSDIRLNRFKRNMHVIQKLQLNAEKNMIFEIDEEIFTKMIEENVDLIDRAVGKQLVVPDFIDLKNDMTEIYKKLTKMYPSTEIGISICTTDGQRFSIGDNFKCFTIQELIKPIIYALILTQHGEDYVHQKIGKETVFHEGTEISLNKKGQPYNAFTTAGSVLATSLIDGRNGAEKFVFILKSLKRLAGEESLTFNNFAYLQLKNYDDHSFAISHYMNENKCFDGSNWSEALDLYFQVLNFEINTDNLAVIAGTLDQVASNKLPCVKFKPKVSI